MKDGQSSWTALMSAMTRAAHLLLDDDPKVFQDDLAMRLSGFKDAAALRGAVVQREADRAQRLGPDLAHVVFNRLRAIMTVRSRYAEDELTQAMKRGIGQYVVLGAGLDSFAYRRPDLAGTLQVFEVDHPSTQQWKRARLADLCIPQPSNLTFVPVDFERQTLREGLGTAGYRSQEPAFLSWLGVTQYLTEAATTRTLEEIAALAPGCEIVFEYTVPEELLEGMERQYLASLKQVSAQRGEPWQGFFEPSRLAALLNDLGFTEVTDLDSELLNARYFAHRHDGLRTPEAHHEVKARVRCAA